MKIFRGFFDNIDHHTLVNILRKRIHDEYFISLIWKFLKAGYIEDWKYVQTFSGTPQGSIISPILVNIYLNEFDKYMEKYMSEFRHVVSLRRDDAQKMGYDNLKAWRDLVIRQIPNIAKNQKMDLKNLRWYAAFHDKKTNPHVHIIVYSTNEREGFLTNHGIEKIRSGFANDIYADELHHIYEQQTNLRNLFKKESEQLMKQLAKSISENKIFDAEIINLVSKLMILASCILWRN